MATCGESGCDVFLAGAVLQAVAKGVGLWPLQLLVI